MKRKTLFLLSLLTISVTLLSGCNSANSVENSETIETTAIESETTEEPVTTTQESDITATTETAEPQTETTIDINNSGSSMGQMSAPEIQSNDFVVEPFGPQTMYVIESVSGKEGPNESDFKEIAYLWKNESVSVIGVVKSYKGEECLWYRLNTGEFISSEYLTTEKPANASDVVGGEETSPISNEGTPTTNQDNQELPDINLDDIAGTPSNNSGQTTTADGRPFYQSHQDGGDAPSTHVWSN